MDIMGVIADATNVISEGEVQQMANAGNATIDEKIYFEVIYRKTAKLFESAAQIGAILAGADQQPMADYGKHLGLAFQIIDDVLDYQGDVSAIGKNVGDDLSEGKMTLPLVHARDQLTGPKQEIICQAIETKSAENFSDILAAVQSCGSLDYSIEQAKLQAELAKKALTGLPDSQFKTVMADLADFSVSRLA
jgi:octaprenyl-diphosphate synthase